MSPFFPSGASAVDFEHCTLSAYHPMSQGALERFHHTLKTIQRLTVKSLRNWDERIPLLLFAATEVTQESLGFSPSELVLLGPSGTIEGEMFGN